MFYLLKDELSSNLEIKVPPTWTVEPIEANASIGKQIKYYRRIANIKQEDLSIKLGYSRDALHHIENSEMKLVDINLIKSIIKELDIKDKLNINDDYIKFLLNNPCKTIYKIRNELGLSRKEFSEILDVSITSIRRWELGNSHISRSKYNKLKNV
ncbi:MAG: helix-turn-helix domain-containing protein [Bacilli bacterium]